MAEDYNVGDLVAEFIAACDVSTVFGIVSIHNIPMLDAIARRNSLRFVMARGEMGAGHMADGFSRASGHLGVLITSTGPGAANAVPALVEANFASSPVLHITSQTSTKFIDRDLGTVHDVPGQADMLRAICKSHYRVRTAQEAFALLQRAATDAVSTPSGPVSIEIPIDIQRTVIERPAGLDTFKLTATPPVVPGLQAIDDLAAMVAKARRPMLWTGSGARHAGVAIAKLLDMGFCMVTSWDGRGVVSEDHPQNLGGLNGVGSSGIEAFYETVDLMIVVGSRLRGHETLDFTVPLPKNRVHIDIDPRADGRNYTNNLFVRGDSALTLEALVDRVEGSFKVAPSYVDEFAKMKTASKNSFRDSLGAYATFSEQLRAALPKDGIFVRDITLSHSTWGNRLFPVHGPRDSIYPVGAAIGPGLQLGIGASLGGGGRKVVSVCGDGGFMLNAMELWTAAQEQVDIVIVVMNDGGYGVIKHIQDASYGGRRNYGDLAAPDFEKFAALAGVGFWKVTAANGFGPAVSEALAAGGPALVEVDMKAVGDMPPFFPYGPKT